MMDEKDTSNDINMHRESERPSKRKKERKKERELRQIH